MSRSLVSMLCLLWFSGVAVVAEAERPRVIVSTDIGGSDPDDFQSMVHYLVYADRFDTEGLISSPPHAGRAKHLHEALDAYASDWENLRTWAEYPEAESLRSIVVQGAIEPQKGETPAALSEGAERIIERAGVDDPRSVYVLVWGSLTDVAQAVHADPSIKKKLRIYSIGSWNTRQDPAARDYLYQNHPDLWWIESDTTFRGMYQGGAQSGEWGNRSFPARHVAGHGRLGALFMEKKRDIKMGDTPSVLYLLHGDPDRPSGPHWGGSYTRPEPDRRPRYWRDDRDGDLIVAGKPGAKTVSRWRVDFLADWRDRMDRAAKKKP